MPDERLFDIDPEIESLLAELEVSDLDPVAPPPQIWAGIERQLADEPAPVLELTRRRSSVFANPLLLGVAAAFVLVVVGVAVVMNRVADDAVLATAELTFDADAFDPLGAGASATAQLVERSDGYAIVLADASLPTVDDDADLELWLIGTDDAGQIVDIAPISLVSGSGTYTVPAALDVRSYQLVDISVEPRDGDETHSGRSILRGALVDV